MEVNLAIKRQHEETVQYYLDLEGRGLTMIELVEKTGYSKEMIRAIIFALRDGKEYVGTEFVEGEERFFNKKKLQ